MSIYYDNTRLSTYKECPRKYLLRHVLGWTVDYGKVAAPLVFGGAWHAGQDKLWKGAKSNNPTQLLELAFEGFLEHWTESGYSRNPGYQELEDLGARTPMTAKEMYYNYIKQRWNILSSAEILGIEQSFAVPLPNSNIQYIGKLDKVIKLNGRTTIIEHKTTSLYRVSGFFEQNYLDSWWSSSQVKGYEYGGTLFYGSVDDVWVDCALVHKKIHEGFKFVPVSHSVDLIQEWVTTTLTWANNVTEAIRQHKAGVSAAVTFPKNEDSCFGKYGSCPFLDICRIVPDPTKLEGPPPGFKVEVWEPFDVKGFESLKEQLTMEKGNG